ASNLGSALTVNVLVPATTYIPVGTLFNIVQTQTGTAQSGTNGSTVAVTVQNPTNPLYTFAAVPLAGTVAGLVTIRAVTVPLQVSLVLPPTVLPPAQPLAAPVASVLLNLPVTADVTSVLAALNAISDPALVVTSEAQLAPSTPNLATPFVAFQASRQFENLWTNRLDDTMCGQVGLVNEQSRSCRKSDPHTGWWLKGFGSVGSQDAQKSFTGYDTQLYGTMMAYDAPLSMRSSSGKTRIGGGFGYARSSIMGHTFAANSNFDTYKAMAYIGHEDGPWFVHGNASFGWNDYSSKRHIMFPGIDRTARANYSGQEYTGFVTTGYHFTVNGTTLTPLASLKFTHLDLGGYKENGAGDISLNVNSQSYDFLESGLGAKVAHPFATSGNAYLPKGTLVPEIHTKWLYEIINPSVKNTSTYVVPGSGSLTTPGMTSDANMFNVGTGLTFLSCECSAKTWSLEGVYDYDWTPHGYSSHQAMMRLTSSF
ncbi:MAG: autotransporter outer membrane beta-barrel domain-containing protein, partial [Alphaproteobacteria bacterium]|nr:autotransporter outer membrane beta-barrel domain-containing protein [Alphaproteobacteria bacterium]